MYPIILPPTSVVRTVPSCCSRGRAQPVLALDSVDLARLDMDIHTAKIHPDHCSALPYAMKGSDLVAETPSLASTATHLDPTVRMLLSP